jgi:5'(3')-deoxyribonucleotidase
VFIDDLPEFLGEPAFPKNVERILFDPSAVHSIDECPFQLARSWREIERLVLQPRSAAIWT